MSEDLHEIVRPTDPVGRVLFQIARALAIFGGFLCCAMALLVTVSVTGRYLFASPVPGDYDLVAILSGSAVFSFLPLCQLIRGNVVVDFFTSAFPDRAKAFLDAIGSLLFLGVATLLTWRLVYGGLDFHRDQEVLAAFGFYRWWTVPYDVACLIVLMIVILYTLIQDIGVLIMGGAAPAARKPIE